MVRADWLDLLPGASRAWVARMDIVRVNGVLCWEDKNSGVRLPMHLARMPRGDEILTPRSVGPKEDIWDISGELQSREDVELKHPLHSVEELLGGGEFDHPKQIAADYGDEYFLCYWLDASFLHAYRVLGYQGLMLMQHDNPDLLHYLLERYLAQAREEMLAWKQAGAHGAFVCDCFSGADSISPRAYDEWAHAYNVLFFEQLNRIGTLSILQLCGAAVPRLDRMVESGAKAVSVEESKKDFVLDIEEVVDRVKGRAAVFGNIDAVRFGAGGTMDEMAAEVKRQAKIGTHARGFVVGTESPVPLDTNPRNVDAMVTTAHSIQG